MIASTMMAEQPYSVWLPSSAPNRIAANRYSYQISGKLRQHRRAYRTRLIVTYRIHSLKHSITVYIHIHGSSTLDTPIHIPIPSVGKTQIFFLERYHRITDRELDLGQVVRGCRGWEDVALIVLVVLGARYGFVDSFDESVVNQTQGSTCVYNGSVVGSVDGLAIDGGGCGLDLPEALAVINAGVVGFGHAGSSHDVLVDKTKSVKALLVC